MEDRFHIHYGAIDAAALPQQQPGPLPTPDTQPAPAKQAIAGQTTAALTSHQRLLEAYEIQQKAKTVIAPTIDDDVKAKLREICEPICLFGEGPFERRERLRVVLARSGIKYEPTVPPVHIQPETSQRQLFFSKGGRDLVVARLEIAKYSLPRAVKRLRDDKSTAGTVDPLEVDRRVATYNQAFGQQLQVHVSQVGSERPLSSGKFSPDGNLFATTSWAPTVKVWNVPSCDEVGSGFHGHKDRVSSVTWNPAFKITTNVKIEDDNIDIIDCTEGWHFASGGFDSNIYIWKTGSSIPIECFEGHEERINRVESHPSGKYIASTSHDETWRLWDITSQTELLIQEGHSSPVFGLRCHPDGSLVFTGDLGGVVRGWDLRTGRTVLPLLGHVKQILGITINPWRTNHVATCSDDNTVRVWDIRKQRCIDMILAHNKLISEVVYEPRDGRFLMTTSYDDSLKLWSSMEFTCIRTLVGHEARVMGGDISNDGQCIASVSFDRTFKLWTATKEES